MDSLCNRSLQRLKILFTLWQLQHHSLFIGSFSIYRGSGNTTQFSHSTFPYTVAVATTLTVYTFVFHIICWGSDKNSNFSYKCLFSICCGNSNNTNFLYTCFPYYMLWQQQHHSLFVQCSFSICCGSNNTTHFLYACFPYAVAAATSEHHSLFIQCLFSICCGSNTTTHFSYSACFPYAVAATTLLTFYTLVFHMLWQQQHYSLFIRLFSICCGSSNK